MKFNSFQIVAKNKNKISSLKLCCFLIILFSFQSVIFSQEKELPNIIYILADDLGYGDISHLNNGSKIITPNIDKLASEGITFTDAHSNSAVCTPTRYGILTGRYAWRTWMKSGVLWSYDKPLITKNRTTVASLLKKKGYATACIGKWHLGLGWQKNKDSTVNFKKAIKETPNDIGFDEFYGITASLDIPPYFYIKNRKITASKISTIEATTGKGFWRKGPIGNDFKHEDVLPHLTNKAIEYINKHSKRKKPFFLYFPLPAPHTPILPTPEFKGKSNAGDYGDFVLMVDNIVKQIEEALKNKGIAENTLIIFTSDNGFSPAANTQEQLDFGHTPSKNYRGYKADIYEGGHRIPFVAKWPAKIKKGITSNQTICLTDFMATTAAITGEKINDSEAEDSYNLLPILLGEKLENPIREATVHHSIDGVFSMRQGKWKLIFSAGSGGWSYPTKKELKNLELPKLQLYNLETDASEKINVIENNPQIVEKLTNLMQKYIENGRSTLGKPQENDTETILFQK